MSNSIQITFLLLVLSLALMAPLSSGAPLPDPEKPETIKISSDEDTLPGHKLLESDALEIGSAKSQIKRFAKPDEVEDLQKGYGDLNHYQGKPHVLYSDGKFVANPDFV